MNNAGYNLPALKKFPTIGGGLMRGFLLLITAGLCAAVLAGCSVKGAVVLPIDIPDQHFDSGTEVPAASTFALADVDVSQTSEWQTYAPRVKSVDRVRLTGSIYNLSGSQQITLNFYISDTTGLHQNQLTQAIPFYATTLPPGTTTVDTTLPVGADVNAIIRDGKFTLYGVAAVTGNPALIKVDTSLMKAFVTVTTNLVSL